MRGTVIQTRIVRREAAMARNAAGQARHRLLHPKRELVRKARQRAKKNALPFTITEHDFEYPTHCPVLGIELHPGTGKQTDSSPSLDRTRPALGYVPGNVRVISYRANTLKSSATLKEARLVVAYLEREYATVT